MADTAQQEWPGLEDPNDTALALLAQVGAARARGGSDLDHLPHRLSPSRASDFVQCPQVFYYKTICGIREPGSIATTRGTIAHSAFERIFDHPAGERTPDLAVSYLRPAWQEMTNLELDEEVYPSGSPEREKALQSAHEYRAVAPPGSETETEMLAFAERVVRNWFNLERVNNFDPTHVELPDGTFVDGRELHVGADMFGVNLHGYIDRLDRWMTSTGPRYAISDYKTGKAPGEGKNYHPRTMERITYEAFFAMRVYALLCWETFGIQVSRLRLLYVKNETRETAIKELDVTAQMMRSTKEEIRTIWKQVTASARTGRWQTRTGPLCDYCYFNDICPAFNPDIADLPVSDAKAG